MPTISPRPTESDTSRIPAARLVRLRTSKTTSPGGTDRFGYTADNSRPTISWINSWRSMSARSRVAIVSPSRSTVTRSREREDFVQPMGNVDDAHALRSQSRDDLEQALDLAIGERRRRLVHDQNPGVARRSLSRFQPAAAPAWSASRPAVRDRSTRRRDSGARRARAARSLPAHAPPRRRSSIAIAMFSPTVRSGNRDGC